MSWLAVSKGDRLTARGLGRRNAVPLRARPRAPLDVQPPPEAAMAALAAPPSMPAPQPPGADRKKPRLSRKARREQSRAWLSAAAAAEQAASVPAEAAEAEAPPAPHVAVEVVSDAEAPRPLAPPLTERTDASRSDFSDGDALHSNDSAAWPLPVRATAVAATQLLVWLTQLWAVVAGIALVAPLAALHVALPALFARPLAVMRAVAQRPLVVMSIAVAAPLYLAEFSWGIDFDAMPERPTSMPDLVRAVRCSPGASRLHAALTPHALSHS